MTDRNELLKALSFIQEMCIVIGECDDCPLRDREGNGCYLMEETPNHWKVKTDSKDDWRAFYD